MEEIMGAIPGSREPSPSSTGLGPSGFDPERYVSGAAAAAMWPDHEHRLYYPCDLGVHLCGANHEDNYFYTIGNFPCATEEEATALWLAMKAECEVEREAADFLVDRNGVDGHDDDFWSNRQMLARIDAIAMEARQGGDGTAPSRSDDSAGR
jgi:hypothetical protein